MNDYRAGYMSGGVENPFYCQMKHKFEPEFETQFDGFNVAYKLQFNDDTGRKIPGVSSMYPHQGEDYFYNYDSEETPADDSAEAMRRALETGKYTKVIPSQPNLEETPAKTFAEAMGRAYDTGQWVRTFVNPYFILTVGCNSFLTTYFLLFDSCACIHTHPFPVCPQLFGSSGV